MSVVPNWFLEIKKFSWAFYHFASGKHFQSKIWDGADLKNGFNMPQAVSTGHIFIPIFTKIEKSLLLSIFHAPQRAAPRILSKFKSSHLFEIIFVSYEKFLLCTPQMECPSTSGYVQFTLPCYWVIPLRTHKLHQESMTHVEMKF